ncbi:MAG: hypothetical protein P8O07_06600 [Crocinitomicaceae bacterium]|nr:hypothetical protein [Crocinitomicaceae bacterium]
MNLISEIPLWWLPIIAILALGASLWYYAKKDWKKEISTSLLYTLVGLRFLSLFLIELLLLGILLESTTYKEEKPILLTIVDDSSSMKNYQDSSKVFSSITHYQHELRDQFGDKFDYEFIGLNGHSIALDSLNFNGTSTDLDAVLSTVYDQYYNRNLGGIVLISDGNYNAGANPVYTGEKFKFVPIYTLGVGDTIQKKDILINTVLTNDIAFLGNQFPIELGIEGFQVSGQRTQVGIYRAGKLLQQKEVVFSNEGYDLQKLNFFLEADQIGFNEYSIELRSISNESNYQNNSRSIYVEVLDARSKILLLANGPHPDMGAIKNTLVQDQNYEVITARDVESLETIKNYDLIIWHEPEKGFSEALLNRLETENKSVWMIIGPSTSNAVLRQLPLGITSTVGRQTDEVQAALNERFTRFEISQKAKEELANFPPLVTHYGALTLNKPADVLLYQRVGPVKKKDPLFFFVTGQNTKFGVTYGEGLWRWRIADYLRNQNHQVFDELVNKTVQYLMVNANSSKLRITLPKEFLEGEEVILGASFYNESMDPITTVPIKLKLKNSEEELIYDFKPNESSYELRLGALEAGTYGWEASATFEGETYSKTGSFLVRKLELEAMNTKSNFMLLNQLSVNSGAEFFLLEQHKELLKELSLREDMVTVSSPSTAYSKLIDYWWWLVLIVLFLTSEWFIRRYSGAY